MTTVYLIRHAQSEGNLYRQFDGQHNSPLTKLGCRQAEAVGRRFENVRLDAVYASDQQRAMDTAKAIASHHGLDVIPSAGLREIFCGIWEHMSWGDIRERWPVEMDRFHHEMSQQLEKWMTVGADPLEVSGRRLAEELFRIVKENEGKTVAVVSHGDAMQLALCLLHRLPFAGPEAVNAYMGNGL